jgi:hypothetical protein
LINPFPNTGVQHSFEIQYGGRPPSWIPNNANCEVTLKEQLPSGCVSNFVKIGQSVPELQHSFEIQYGDRPPSWILHNANIEVNLSTEQLLFCLRVSNFVESVNPFPNYSILSKSNMAAGRHLGFPTMQISR